MQRTVKDITGPWTYLKKIFFNIITINPHNWYLSIYLSIYHFLSLHSLSLLYIYIYIYIYTHKYTQLFNVQSHYLVFSIHWQSQCAGFQILNSYHQLGTDCLNMHGYIGCLNIHGYIRRFNIHRTHVTVNDSSNNNVEFFLVSDLKIVCYKNY